MNWKTIGAAVALVLAFGFGHSTASNFYGKKLAELEKTYAERTQALEALYRQKEQENAQAVIKAWEERDAARADAIDLRGDLDRVRDEAAALRRELSRTPDDPCAPLRARLAECASLCERGACLLERGARKLQEVAGDKDALARLAAP